MSRSVAVREHFEFIAVSMADLPIYNPQLQVETVGFHLYQEGEIGVLVTPWCMNLVLIPSDASNNQEAEGMIGSKRMISLPSGQYEFVMGWYGELGVFYSCSLFSPMFEFETQEQAIETAEEVIKAVFEPENHAPTDRQSALQKQREEQSKLNEKQELREKRSNAQLSRRGFLTAGLVNEKNKELSE